MSHMLFQKYSLRQGILMGSPGNPRACHMLLGIQSVGGDRTVGTWAMEGKEKKGRRWE